MRQKSGLFAAAAAFVLLFPVLAQAQVNSVRGPVQGSLVAPGQAPVRLEIKEDKPTPAKEAQSQETRPSKFPNIDTAKNRQDYDLGTPKADGIRLGCDADTGDTVMGSTPPKKRQEPDPFTAKPIEVRPIIPVLP